MDPGDVGEVQAALGDAGREQALLARKPYLRGVMQQLAQMQHRQ
jgi:hypothetical protein